MEKVFLIVKFNFYFPSRCLENNIHVFNHKVETEGKPVTNQKSSGRCWLFAGLNVARQPFVKHYNIEDFEFSQAHLFYWDKIERANYFLQNISEFSKSRKLFLHGFTFPQL